MGRDKALVLVDGVAMSARVRAALLGGGCSPVVAIGGRPAALGPLGFEVVPDEFPGEGPLGGVITALTHQPTAHAVLVAACDLPQLSATTVQALVEGLHEAGAEVAVARGERLQPACAVWRVDTGAVLRERFLSGERRLVSALDGLHVVEIAVHPQDLANVNTPSDLPQ
jgi:molybdopterin-guanine dinucleotide biosynthesis protein A